MSRRPKDSIRLVPAFDDEFVIYENLEQKHNWKQSTETLDDGLVQWSVPEMDVKVSWFTDIETSVKSFIIEGPDRQKIATQIEGEIEILQPENFAAFLEPVKDWRQMLMHRIWTVGLACPDEFHNEAFSLIESYLHHEDHFIREAAIIAAVDTGWKQFISPIEAMRKDDDADVRQTVEAYIGYLYTANGLQKPEKTHLPEGLTQLDMPRDVTEQLRIQSEDWVPCVPIRGKNTAYIYDQLPTTDLTDEETYTLAKQLSDVWNERISKSDHPLQKIGGVYCPVCHIASIDLDKLGLPCPKCKRELLRFNWTTF